MNDSQMVVRKDLQTRRTEFITRAKESYGDLYDYSDVDYVNARTHVLIHCTRKYHRSFLQVPHSHLIGRIGCPDCKSQFFERAHEKYGDKFDYSQVVYENEYTAVKIICPDHGVLEIEPRNHLRSVHGCEDCFLDNYRRFTTTEEFIEVSRSIWGDKYSYEKTEYGGSVTSKIIVTCRVHGDLEIRPSHHLRDQFGGGCKDCASEKRTLSLDEFIQRSISQHGEFFDYSKVTYSNSYTHVKIVCPVHGEFEMTPAHHMEGSGCRDCFEDRRRSTTEEFIRDAREVHGETYDYSEFIYEGIHETGKIICRIHGGFDQSRANHIHSRQGCPWCKNKSEGKIAVILNEIAVVHQTYRIDEEDGSGKRFYYDFYLPEHDLIIERDGEQHYKDIYFQKKRERTEQENDRRKTELAKSKGLRVCRIPYWLNDEEVRVEISNILDGRPSYPDVPDLEHEKTKPKPHPLLHESNREPSSWN